LEEIGAVGIEPEPALDRKAFLAELPSYFGLGVINQTTFAEDAGGLHVRYRWNGTDVYQVAWKRTVPAWTIRELPNGIITFDQTFDAAANGFALATIGMREGDRLSPVFLEALGSRIPQALPQVVQPPAPGRLATNPAVTFVAVIAVTMEGVDLGPAGVSPVTDNPPMLNMVGARPGSRIEFRYPSGETKAMPVSLHEYMVAAIDAEFVVSFLTNPARFGLLLMPPIAIVPGGPIWTELPFEMANGTRGRLIGGQVDLAHLKDAAEMARAMMRPR
jgi:hypothetical protein